MSIQSLLDYISVIPDIRQQGKVKHKLSAILFLTVCAVIAGADEWQEIEDFGHERRKRQRSTVLTLIYW
ncbi:protein [Escherichia coli]|uniref:transposase family protein n=1 Tax=Escherichia coli TaxID=562 RepID=UPI000E2AE8C2|nr:transposase family protein [Escherichia coli]SVF48420.1 protein [Escherichia coli]